jgi:hypothetical protein
MVKEAQWTELGKLAEFALHAGLERSEEEQTAWLKIASSSAAYQPGSYYSNDSPKN